MWRDRKKCFSCPCFKRSCTNVFFRVFASSSAQRMSFSISSETRVPYARQYDFTLSAIFHRFVKCDIALFEFYRNSTDWLSHDAGSACGESRNRLLTVLYLFSFCLLVLCFRVAPSEVFFEYMSFKLFRWYLLILIGLLTCI